MNTSQNKVKNIARITPIEDAQALWSALDGIGVATESFVAASRAEAPIAEHDQAKVQAALEGLARALHTAKISFAKATGWLPVSVDVERLQEGVAGKLFTQESLDRAIAGALHFDVMVEAFTFRFPELKQQAVEQAYNELLAAEPMFTTLGDWAQDTLRRACADSVARIYGSAAVAAALQT